MKKTTNILRIGDLVRYSSLGDIGVIMKATNYTYCDVFWIKQNITDKYVEKSHLSKVS